MKLCCSNFPNSKGIVRNIMKKIDQMASDRDCLMAESFFLLFGLFHMYVYYVTTFSN